MPDDTGTALTAKPIPGSLTISGQSGPMNIVPHNMAEAIEFARVMSKAGVLLRPAFRDNPGLCLGVSLQAWRSNADPFALASKAYVVNDQIAYESQAIHALVNSSPVISRRLRATYSGTGPSRQCKVIGWLRGEDEPFEYESPKISDIKVKNSPLWQSDPDQQLFYFASRSWARRWVPEVLLGIYTTDEIDGQIIDVTADRIDAHAAALQPAQAEKTFLGWDVLDHTGEVYSIKSTERAVEALRKILITAAAISPSALATAWENNAEFLADLSEAEEDGAEPLHLLYEQLAPQDSPAPDQPEQKGEARRVAVPENGPLNPSEPKAGDTPASDEPAQRSAADDPSQAPAAGRSSFDQTPPAAAQAEAQDAATPDRDTQVVSETASPPYSATQSGERHDPFWDRDSLRVEPPVGRNGRPDHKAWTALLIPRIRQAWSVPLLNELFTANQDLLDAYASAFGSRPRDELMGEFEDAKVRVGREGGR